MDKDLFMTGQIITHKSKHKSCHVRPQWVWFLQMTGNIESTDKEMFVLPLLRWQILQEWDQVL